MVWVGFTVRARDGFKVYEKSRCENHWRKVVEPVYAEKIPTAKRLSLLYLPGASLPGGSLLFR